MNLTSLASLIDKRTYGLLQCIHCPKVVYQNLNTIGESSYTVDLIQDKQKAAKMRGRRTDVDLARYWSTVNPFYI